MIHIHLGATSRLGLGLIVPLVTNSGFSTYLCSRPRDTNPHSVRIAESLKHTLCYQTNNGVKNSLYKISGVTTYLDKNNNGLGLSGLLGRPDVGLLTTSLGSGLADAEILRKIVDALTLRHHSFPASQPLYIIACENYRTSYWLQRALWFGGLNEVYKTIQSYKNDLRFVPAVVDRVCTNVEVIKDQDGRQGVVVTVAQPAAMRIGGEWAPYMCRLIRSTDGIQVAASSEIISDWRAKLWIFCGAHLIVAMKAIECGTDSIAAFLHSPFGSDYALKVITEVACVAGFQLQTSGSEYRESLVASTLQRFLTCSDSAIRVVGDRWQTSAKFLSNFHLKVALPIIDYLQGVGNDGSAPTLVQLTFEKIHPKILRQARMDLELSSSPLSDNK